MPKSSKEYREISSFYGTTVAKRSQVPLMNHINEGIDIMERLNASAESIRAYCLHPVFQSDNDFSENYEKSRQFDSYVMTLVMEYRKSANAYLCRPSTDGFDMRDIKRAVGNLITPVKHMLIADKIQNRKDFMLYHHGTHKRSDQLFSYFNNWIEYLGVSHMIEEDNVS